MCECVSVVVQWPDESIIVIQHENAQHLIESASTENVWALRLLAMVICKTNQRFPKFSPTCTTTAEYNEYAQQFGCSKLTFSLLLNEATLY